MKTLNKSSYVKTADPYTVALRLATKKGSDDAKVFSLLSKSLKAGNANAAYALGTWYLHGKYVKVNLRRAVALLKQAATAGIPNALHDLAVCYQRGVGVRKDKRLAQRLELQSILMQSMDDIRLVEIWRKGIDRQRLIGYVVEQNSTFVVIQCLSDSIHLDGYSLIRINDITGVESDPARGSFYKKALQLRKERPSKPRGLDLTTMAKVLRSLTKLYPLISIERERLRPGECSVGKIRIIGKNSVVLKSLTSKATWEGNSRPYQFEAITKIDFDNEYLDALAKVSALRKGKTSVA